MNQQTVQKTSQTIVSSIVVAGLSGGSGKSVAAVGLIAALSKKGRVVPFKKGPDYIDAGWMTRAAGRPCYNLDPYLMSPEAIAKSFYTHSMGADYAIIEGNRGLYDGVNVDGGFSTAELALQLDLPVLLVVNCSKTTRTVAAMVLGCRGLEPDLRLAGVILNQIATPRHESIIRQAVEKYTGVPVVGVLPRVQKDIFPMRHLGVTPHQESDKADSAVAQLESIVENHFDLDTICTLMQDVQPVGRYTRTEIQNPAPEVRIGILRDMAFQFYYEENLDALRNLGAELVMIDALQAASVPEDLDGLYIGGGFPETSARALANNKTFRDSIKKAAEEGLPIYAECGGLIFLGRSIILEGEEFPLTGVLPITFGMGRKPQAHGYSIFTVELENPFYPIGTRIKGHEFRYSTVADWKGESQQLALHMERGTGFQDKRDGLVKNNVLALYTHVLASGTPEWATGIFRAARKYKNLKQ